MKHFGSEFSGIVNIQGVKIWRKNIDSPMECRGIDSILKKERRVLVRDLRRPEQNEKSADDSAASSIRISSHESREFPKVDISAAIMWIPLTDIIGPARETTTRA